MHRGAKTNTSSSGLCVKNVHDATEYDDTRTTSALYRNPSPVGSEKRLIKIKTLPSSLLSSSGSSGDDITLFDCTVAKKLTVVLPGRACRCATGDSHSCVNRSVKQ